LANTLEGFPECFDLLDFQVNKACHSFLNDNISFISVLTCAWHAYPQTRNFAKRTDETMLSSRSWGLEKRDARKHVHVF